MVGATVVADVTALVFVEGKVSVLTFKKDGVEKTIAFCGTDCGSWLKEVSLIPKEYQNFETWITAISPLWMNGGYFIDEKTFNSDGLLHVLKTDLPEIFSKLDRESAQRELLNYISKDPQEDEDSEEFVLQTSKEDLAFAEESLKLDEMYAKCVEELQVAIGPDGSMPLFHHKPGLFEAIIPGNFELLLPEGFVIESSILKKNIVVSHGKLKEMYEKLYNWEK
jgi:hypothetical protein